MSSPDARNPLLRVLVLLAAVLALVLLAELAWFALPADDDAAALSPQSLALAEPVAGPGEAPQRSAYNEVYQRTLFNPSRRPVIYRPPPVEKKKEDPLQKKWSLSAVIDSGSGIYAIFALKSGGERLRLYQGEELAGWRVQSITPGKVELKRGDETQAFILGAPDPEGDAGGKKAKTRQATPPAANSSSTDAGPKRPEKGPMRPVKTP